MDTKNNPEDSTNYSSIIDSKFVVEHPQQQALTAPVYTRKTAAEAMQKTNGPAGGAGACADIVPVPIGVLPEGFAEVDIAESMVPILLDGISRLAHLLLDAEVRFLCGADLLERTQTRQNFRAGFYYRMLKTRYGKIDICMPKLRFIHARPAMIKRFRRLEPHIIAFLMDAYQFGVEPGYVDAIVKKLWTVNLEPGLLAKLSERIRAMLVDWRTHSVVEPHKAKAVAHSVY